jgi:NADH dehydrogenase/NADH:ubiquinone oxidoreductase subunit G
MSAVHELAEKIEHMSHGPGSHGEHKASGTHIGITMAVLGVMLALCSALVGAQRTELIESMVLQSTKWGVAQAEAISPKKDEIAKVEATLRGKRASSGRADDEDTAEIKDLIASSTEDMADLLTPDAVEVKRFGKLARTYDKDRREAKEDAEAYEGAIEAHQEAAEHYEWAQLAAEVGIVVASIALLLSSRAVWTVSLALGLGCAGILGVTFFETRGAVAAAEQKIKQANENEVELEKDDDEEGEAAAPEKGEGESAKAEAAPKGEAPKEAEGTKVRVRGEGAKTE